MIKTGVSCILSPEAGAPMDNTRVSGTMRPYKGGRPRRGQTTGWEGRKTFNTSLALDVDQYDKVCELAKKEGVTIKVIMYELLNVGLLNYKSR